MRGRWRCAAKAKHEAPRMVVITATEIRAGEHPMVRLLVTPPQGVAAPFTVSLNAGQSLSAMTKGWG